MIWLRLSQAFSAVVGVFNLFIGVVNLMEARYLSSAINIAIGVTLAFLIISQEWKIWRLRDGLRELREYQQHRLDECWRFGICPDCANVSLAVFDEQAICSEVGCNSRFRRDLKTGQWSRIE